MHVPLEASKRQLPYFEILFHQLRLGNKIGEREIAFDRSTEKDNQFLSEKRFDHFTAKDDQDFLKRFSH